jgi:hypothetical protein
MSVGFPLLSSPRVIILGWIVQGNCRWSWTTCDIFHHGDLQKMYVKAQVEARVIACPKGDGFV